MFRILYLLSISSMLLAACQSAYKNLHAAAGDPNCVEQFKPHFVSVLYHTEVDVTGRHFSGLLLIKTMSDSSTRVVFTSAVGPKFFDFEFPPDTGFRVLFIMKQLDKKAAIKTLRKDFELILFRNMDFHQAYSWAGAPYHYYSFPQQKGVNYYVTDSSCSQLIRMEKASKKRTIVQAVMLNYAQGVPDTIGISHKNFNFTISLKRLHPDVTR
jgi:hypothetical protein